MSECKECNYTKLNYIENWKFECPDCSKVVTTQELADRNILEKEECLSEIEKIIDKEDSKREKADLIKINLWNEIDVRLEDLSESELNIIHLSIKD